MGVRGVIFDWIETELHPMECTSDGFIYDDMDSQSGRALPIIYRPFDLGERSHWRDRGAVWDYLLAGRCERGRVLDFGPGDGWPSLVVAPFISEVAGVDASRRRVEVCTQNAARLGMHNAKFVHVPPGSPLPFGDDSFDAVLAASSVEQTPDPRSTLREIHRVLKPGGRLRITYESLTPYRGDGEHGIWLWEAGRRSCRLILFDRDIDGEQVVQYSLDFAISDQELAGRFRKAPSELTFADLSVERLEGLRDAIVGARVLTTTHPSGRTLAHWLLDAGFVEVLPSHDGAACAAALYDLLPSARRPRSLVELDEYLRPVVAAVVQMKAPTDIDPMITALK